MQKVLSLYQTHLTYNISPATMLTSLNPCGGDRNGKANQSNRNRCADRCFDGSVCTVDGAAGDVVVELADASHLWSEVHRFLAGSRSQSALLYVVQELLQ